MIIVDDASTDGTPYLVEQYAKKDNRIKFIRNEKIMVLYFLM
jgi:glycosyltransferase involved in cell wall biosynthesis